ncbi:DoxX family protein, partial [Klebsiella pneumoniae]
MRSNCRRWFSHKRTWRSANLCITFKSH